MERTIKKLAQMSGVSARTLRWYEECGLLKPKRLSTNGYRIYGDDEVDRLQQILFYRELGFQLEEIRSILLSPQFDREAALEKHLVALQEKRRQLDILVMNVEKTLKSAREGTAMSDEEKFAGFTKGLVEENEKSYGKEIREKYGSEAVEKANAKVMGMSKEKWAESEGLRVKYTEALKEAMAKGDPAGAEARKACLLHGQWLSFFYDGYCKEYHLAISQMYVDDSRFNDYYEAIAPGAALFLRDAVKSYFGE
ncbi:MAG: MerR family transcriptional regulator [Clostridiales bacterium]|nr:MerR family transcriptional regulator [Clostridiales bacterium]